LILLGRWFNLVIVDYMYLLKNVQKISPRMVVIVALAFLVVVGVLLWWKYDAYQGSAETGSGFGGLIDNAGESEILRAEVEIVPVSTSELAAVLDSYESPVQAMKLVFEYNPDKLIIGTIVSSDAFPDVIKQEVNQDLGLVEVLVAVGESGESVVGVNEVVRVFYEGEADSVEVNPGATIVASQGRRLPVYLPSTNDTL
jgi:hypothetical protein